jgi:hypothetical protein
MKRALVLEPVPERAHVPRKRACAHAHAAPSGAVLGLWRRHRLPAVRDVLARAACRRRFSAGVLDMVAGLLVLKACMAGDPMQTLCAPTADVDAAWMQLVTGERHVYAAACAAAWVPWVPWVPYTGRSDKRAVAAQHALARLWSA